MSRSVIYAEVPRFYAEIERAADASLAARPVIVGGDPRKRGLVQSATEDALAGGVALDMPVLEALERCPRARALRTDMRRYRDVSLRLQGCLRRVAGEIEPAGLGAAYLDGSERPEALAARLCEAVRSELALPLRVGISAVKFVARLAAEESGAAGLLRVAPGKEADFLAPLPVTRLPGVGPQAESRLAQVGVRSAGDVVALGSEALEAALGNRGLEILALARGHGDGRVRGAKNPQSLSQESTLENDEVDLDALATRLRGLAQRLEGALRAQGLAAKRVTLKLRYGDLELTTRSRTLGSGLVAAAEIEAAALDLLSRTDAGSRPVRLVGIILASLVRARRDDRQLELFPARS